MRRPLVVFALLLAAAASGCLFHRVRAPAVAAEPRIDAAGDPPGTIRAWWIGHATVLVKLDDRWILTDPVFSRAVGAFVKRYVAPGVTPDRLPPIDWVLISHAHADHLDHASLRRLGPGPALAVPPGVLTYLDDDLPASRIAALRAWQSVEQDGLRLTAVPARHVDGRWHVDDLWNDGAHTGWVVEYRGMTVYFAGDTGYDPETFREIGRRFAIDLALIPVGPVARLPGTHRMIRARHVDPHEALRLFADVGAAWMMPIHFGTFFRGGERERRAVAAAIDRHPLAARVLLVRAGESVAVPAGASRTP